MKSVFKLVLILILFSVAFFYLRTSAVYNVSLLISDLGGLTYLYSAVGVMFAVFSGFVIVAESQNWNVLVRSTKNEAKELYELWLWSRYLPDSLKEKFHSVIKEYATVVVTKEWSELEKRRRNDAAESILQTFHDCMFSLSKENPVFTGNMFRNFTSFLSYRNERLEYSSASLPLILKYTVLFVDIALVFLSLFLGVHNIWLDYIFLICIVALGSVVYIVIDDLDNPLRPGDWHLTPYTHKELLEKINLAE